jgi:hypothetical protein
MTQKNTDTEEIVEFRLSKRKFVTNLIKLIPTMRKIRNKAAEIIKKGENSGSEIQTIPKEVIMNDLMEICEPPHRRIGTSQAHEIEDLLLKKFKELGLESVQKESVDVINWSCTNWKLEVSTEETKMEIPCFYVLNTGFTSEKGINAPLVYVSTGSEKDFKGVDVRDKIVVADIEFPVLPLGRLLNLAKPFYVSDPTGVIDKSYKIVLTFALQNFPPQALGGKIRDDSVYWRAYKRGAIGLILILRDYPSNINTHWGPYDGSMKPIPALYVGKYDGIKLRELVQNASSKGTLILEGTKEPSIAHNIWGILPGNSEEMLMISSHHDSAFKGATEDGTGVAMVLAQLRTWSKVPKQERPRSLLFILSAGHLYGGIGAEAFARKYRSSLLKNVLVDVNLEHMCAKEVIEDQNTKKFTITDNQALGAVFISRNEHIVAPVIRSFQKHKIENMMCIPDNFFATPPIGEAGHFVVHSGLKVIHWIRSPYYLLTAEDTLDKVDEQKLLTVTQSVTDIINDLMYIPKELYDK